MQTIVNSKQSDAANDIAFYEELSMNAHPALKTQLYDGWVLRFSNGYTNRANSINPIYPSKIPMEEKVDVCEHAYGKQGLPTVFKLTDASPAELDGYLDTRGYEMATPTCLFTKSTLPPGQASKAVIITNTIVTSWQDDFFKMNGLTDMNRMITAAAMMRSIQGDILCAKIIEDEKAVACGMCIVERSYAGLYDIVVDTSYRRRGYGYELCNALLIKASEVGAKSAYLQVVEANSSAVELYGKLGFEYCYQYWYRVKKSIMREEAAV